MTTPADLIVTARAVYNDADAVLYRKSDAELLGYVNEGIAEMSSLQPAMFATIGDLACVAGAVEQAIGFSDAQAITSVLSIHAGAALTPFDIDVMNAFRPNWRNDPAGDAQQWAKLPGDPLRFFIYPKAPVDQVIDISYIRNPTVLTLLDAITEVPVCYFPALVDYVIYRAESADDEHSNTGRAGAHYAAFAAKVKGV